MRVDTRVRRESSTDPGGLFLLAVCGTAHNQPARANWFGVRSTLWPITSRDTPLVLPTGRRPKLPPAPGTDREQPVGLLVQFVNMGYEGLDLVGRHALIRKRMRRLLGFAAVRDCIR